ncbi:MAG: hypothetical protein JSU87_15360 [Gemmatimonadota bacterium]|nr:MAG: hypothetical protein JSU87_15360 [Gemmatimonadota bacterium]
MTSRCHLSPSTMLPLLALAASAGLSSCRTMPATERAQEPQLVFAVAAAAQDAQEVTPTVAQITPGSAEIAGTIATPNPCYEISATLATAKRDLQLQLTARAREGICVQKLGAFEYRATITGLRSGAYEIVIAYSYPETGWEPSAHRLAFNIP